MALCAQSFDWRTFVEVSVELLLSKAGVQQPGQGSRTSTEADPVGCIKWAELSCGLAMIVVQ